MRQFGRIVDAERMGPAEIFSPLPRDPDIDVAEHAPASDWYLMVPPPEKHSGLLWSKPFSQWKVIATFDSQAACEGSRVDFLKSGKKPSLPICMASDDLRFK